MYHPFEKKLITLKPKRLVLPTILINSVKEALTANAGIDFTEKEIKELEKKDDEDDGNVSEESGDDGETGDAGETGDDVNVVKKIVGT